MKIYTFHRKQNFPISVSLIKESELINEGGNAVSNVSRINQENVQKYENLYQTSQKLYNVLNDNNLFDQSTMNISARGSLFFITILVQRHTG